MALWIPVEPSGSQWHRAYSSFKCVSCICSACWFSWFATTAGAEIFSSSEKGDPTDYGDSPRNIPCQRNTTWKTVQLDTKQYETKCFWTCFPLKTWGGGIEYFVSGYIIPVHAVELKPLVLEMNACCWAAVLRPQQRLQQFFLDPWTHPSKSSCSAKRQDMAGFWFILQVHGQHVHLHVPQWIGRCWEHVPATTTAPVACINIINYVKTVSGFNGRSVKLRKPKPNWQ